MRSEAMNGSGLPMKHEAREKCTENVGSDVPACVQNARRGGARRAAQD